MDFRNLITVDRVACNVECASKKRTLEVLSQLISQHSESLNQIEIFDSLIARERLGSTALGKGIALPHGRLKSGDHTICAFVKLNEGIDFDAPDGQPVDLLCAMMVPEESSEEHLEVLALLSEMFRKPEVRDKIRHAQSAEEIYELLTSSADEGNRANFH